MMLDMFESKIEFQARLKPASIADTSGLARTQLFLGALEDQDVGVDRHTHREHEGGHAGQRQRDRYQSEDREHDERVDRSARRRRSRPAVGSGRA